MVSREETYMWLGLAQNPGAMTSVSLASADSRNYCWILLAFFRESRHRQETLGECHAWTHIVFHCVCIYFKWRKYNTILFDVFWRLYLKSRAFIQVRKPATKKTRQIIVTALTHLIHIKIIGNRLVQGSFLLEIGEEDHDRVIRLMRVKRLRKWEYENMIFLKWESSVEERSRKVFGSFGKFHTK